MGHTRGKRERETRTAQPSECEVRHSNPGSFEFKISVRQGVAKFLRDRVPCAVDDHRCGPNRALPHTEREAAGSEGTKLDCDTETVIFLRDFCPAGNVTELFELRDWKTECEAFFLPSKSQEKHPPRVLKSDVCFLGVKRQFICGF